MSELTGPTRAGADDATAASALSVFSAPTREWFTGAFAAPTPAQEGAWAAVQGGAHALVVAPTGSGKTLAAFLWALDGLLTTPAAPSSGLGEGVGPERCRVLYVSPLKALAADVERNLRSPLVGIRQAATRRGIVLPEVRVGVRTGDTPPQERRSFATAPPDILITTPESLFLVLTSAARSGLAGVRTVILDEIHAVAGTKRGAHLAVSLERLDALLPQPAQRIGLSATVNPVETVAAFLSGARTPADGGRDVVVVQPRASKEVVVDVVVPVPDLADLAGAPAPRRGASGVAAGGLPLAPGEVDLSGPAAGDLPRASIWPHVEERVVDLVAANRTTLVFTNSRRGAERLTARMNEVWAERHGADLPDPGTLHPAQVTAQSGAAVGLDLSEGAIARAHHGSMSRAERTRTESDLKAGLLPAVVATSSLELGIDMGSIDLVVQVGVPPSVASGLQRVGRAGHQVGAVSHGVVFPTFRGDLVPAAVIAERMRTGQIEPMHVLTNPLDVLAQQIVAMLAVDDWTVTEIAQVLRRAAPFSALGDGALRAVLDMLAGRYPSEDFAELRARIVWDRSTDLLHGRPGAQRLAVTSGGTIPDRGLYGVFLAAGSGGTVTADDERVAGRPRGGKRVGELDEEMVYESRVGDTFTLGSSTWRIEEITPDRVLVSPAPGLPGRLPFWKGDSPGRPAALGQAIGTWVRAVENEVATGGSPVDTVRAMGLDPWATDNLLAYLHEQREATGRVPDDRTLVLERFRDEIGDWRVVIHSPYGARVHAPWALVIAARLRERFGVDAAAMHSDDGIVLRLPDVFSDLGGSGGASAWPATSGDGRVTDDEPRIEAADLLIDPDDVAAAVRAELGDSALFAARFREAASRALLLPRRRPDRRQPLWQQRQRSAQLLSVAAEYPDFPILLEAARECLQDDFDVTALTDLMRGLARGEIRILEVTTPAPSPFAQSLLFGYTAQFLYDGDAPLAERRAAALTLDPTLLAELLGQGGASQLADLLDPDVVVRTEEELGALVAERQARDAEGVADLLRRLGPLTSAQVHERTRADVREQADDWLATLESARRVIRVRIGGLDEGAAVHWAAVEDAGRLRDALGVALPVGIPEVFTEIVPDPLGDLVRRHARTHGPFPAIAVARRFGLGVAVVAGVLGRLEAAGVLASGRLRPESVGGTGAEFCDTEVLRTLRRRSLAALRSEVEPVPQAALGVFLPRWQGVGSMRGADGLARAIEQLAGAVLPASALETHVLPARVVDYTPAMLDELTATGEVLWCGHGATAGGDGLVSLHLAVTADLTLPAEVVPATGDRLDSPVHRAVLAALAGGGAYFLSGLVTRVRDLLSDEGPQLQEAPASPDAHQSASTPQAVADAVWDLVWSGRVSNDSLAPLRARLGSGTTAHRTRPAPPRLRGLRGTGRPVSALRLASPRGVGAGLSGTSGLAIDGDRSGRWSLLPPREADATIRAHALVAQLLDRHGVVTRAVAPSEQVSGVFGALYRVLAASEQAGRVRRGYFVEHLGGSQFALPGAVDLLREDAKAVDARRGDTLTGLLLAATDPANPYGAALAWPDTSRATAERDGQPTSGGHHRPGRKAGAVVVLVSGSLVLYVERGGRTVLSFTAESAALAAAAAELARVVRTGRMGRVTLQRADGTELLGAGWKATPVGGALAAAGFGPTPRGLRLLGHT